MLTVLVATLLVTTRQPVLLRLPGQALFPTVPCVMLMLLPLVLMLNLQA